MMTIVSVTISVVLVHKSVFVNLSIVIVHRSSKCRCLLFSRETMVRFNFSISRDRSFTNKLKSDSSF